MKNRFFYIIGFIVIIVANYVLKDYVCYTEGMNTISVYAILLESLRPIGIFLLLNIFTQKDYKIIWFIVFILSFMIVEFIFRYFAGKVAIEYNYAIGMILGLIPVYFIDIIRKKQFEKKNIE